jgi:hypothetical protein
MAIKAQVSLSIDIEGRPSTELFRTVKERLCDRATYRTAYWPTKHRRMGVRLVGVSAVGMEVDFLRLLVEAVRKYEGYASVERVYANYFLARHLRRDLSDPFCCHYWLSDVQKAPVQFHRFATPSVYSAVGIVMDGWGA